MLLPELPTQENIAMPLMLAGTIPNEVGSSVEIPANPASTVPAPIAPASSRQAQRVAIGRALATNPR